MFRDEIPNKNDKACYIKSSCKKASHDASIDASRSLFLLFVVNI